MATNDKCKISGRKCKYWRAVSSSGDTYCCNYCYDTGKPRKKGENGECLSCTPPRYGRYKPYWQTRGVKSDATQAKHKQR